MIFFVFRLVFWTILTILFAAIFAYPVGGAVYIAIFFFDGGIEGKARWFSKMIAETLCVPAMLFSLFGNPNPGGSLTTTLLLLGFPWALFLFGALFSCSVFFVGNAARSTKRFQGISHGKKGRDRL